MPLSALLGAALMVLLQLLDPIDQLLNLFQGITIVLLDLLMQLEHLATLMLFLEVLVFPQDLVLLILLHCLVSLVACQLELAVQVSYLCMQLLYYNLLLTSLVL